ncbi:hypothetical protein QAD02_020206 [Eretmocerus hayati]|uniref:Uncharacterized protein n=1 Tax=Eretmocerus hayati TaxID=131215 RepID=A0ACC2PLF4_9HYME|nr:hypothetical protein QAD02_020206 [Eretmocerus hayati]
MELRSHRRRQFQSSSGASASVNNSFRDALPSSALPSVPSSPFAYEPGHHDQEMKLVLPQSTPNIDGSPKLPTPLHNDAFSPIAYRASPFTSSGNSKRFSKLSISGRSYLSRKSKPKKLDFSKRAILAGFEKQRATPDYTGKETVDIFKLLVEKSNHPRIVSKILSYLSPPDLCSVNIVSKSWQRICGSDSKAEERRLKHVILRQCSKENMSMNKSKFEQAIHHMSPRTRSQGREYLTVVSTNLLPVPKIHSTPTSPPVSPSKVIFHSFIKVSKACSNHNIMGMVFTLLLVNLRLF